MAIRNPNATSTFQPIYRNENFMKFWSFLEFWKDEQQVFKARFKGSIRRDGFQILKTLQTLEKILEVL